MEQYIFCDGLTGRRLAQAFADKAEQGIPVKLLVDAVLAQPTGFAQNWLLTTGEILSGHEYFPVPEPAGEVEVQAVLSSSSSGAGAAGTMYLIAVQCARDYLYIANPYFIPDSRVIACWPTPAAAESLSS